jgi:hypothetical protein
VGLCGVPCLALLQGTAGGPLRAAESRVVSLWAFRYPHLERRRPMVDGANGAIFPMPMSKVQDAIVLCSSWGFWHLWSLGAVTRISFYRKY